MLSFDGRSGCLIDRQKVENLFFFVFLVLHVWYTGSDPLVRQVYEFDAHVEDLTLGVRPMSRALWKYRRQITVEHLGNSFQQEVLSGGEEQYKVLNAFLKQVPLNVQLISYICEQRRTRI